MLWKNIFFWLMQEGTKGKYLLLGVGDWRGCDCLSRLTVTGGG